MHEVVNQRRLVRPPRRYQCQHRAAPAARHRQVSGRRQPATLVGHRRPRPSEQLGPAAGHLRSCRQLSPATPARRTPAARTAGPDTTGRTVRSVPVTSVGLSGSRWPASVRVPTTLGRTGRPKRPAERAGRSAGSRATAPGRARTAPCRSRATGRRRPRSSAPRVARAGRLNAPA